MVFQHRISYYRSRFTYNFWSSNSKCIPEAYFSVLVPLLPFFWLSCWKTMLLLITTYPFTRHRSPYTPTVNTMPSSYAINVIYFLLNYTFTVKLHWNSDVFNQSFVISPRTGVLHACLSSKRRNLTTVASGEGVLFRIRLKDYNSGLIIWETKWGWISSYDFGYRRLCRLTALFQLTSTFNTTYTDTPQPLSEDLFTIFFSRNGVAPMEIRSHDAEV